MWRGGPNFQRLDRAIIANDAHMRRIADADPDTYLVEHEAQWRTSASSYLPAPQVAEMFGPYQGAPLQMQSSGRPPRKYAIHCDTSSSGANTAIAVGHVDGDAVSGHLVFDLLCVFRPRDFPDQRIDYMYIEEYLRDLIAAFRPSSVTFDQYNSEMLVGALTRWARANGHGRTAISIRPATQPKNWADAERFKTLLSQRRLHAPDHDLARKELLFLQADGMKVDHPTVGEIRTSDMADAMFGVTAMLMDGSAGVIESLTITELRATSGSPFATSRRPGLGAAPRQSPWNPPHNPARGINRHRRGGY